MEANSPYATPQQSPQELTPLKTSIPKVLGIIHIVYATLGIIGACFGIISMLLVKNLKNLPGMDAPEMSSYHEAMDSIASYTLLDAGIRIILGITLVISGWKLIKYKKVGATLSTIWASARILWVIIYIGLTYSITQEMQAKLSQISPDTVQLQGPMQLFSMIFGAIFIVGYPVTSLILLNKKNVKETLT